jgi:hypothetical protein
MLTQKFKGSMTLTILFLILTMPIGQVATAQDSSHQDKSDSFWDFHGSIGEKEEGKFETYVPPISSPLLNESPQIVSELRPIFWFHKLPKDSIAGDGEVYLLALQARLALTERLAVIATKDGYAWLNMDRTLEDESGFANIALGLKYALLYRPEDEFILSIGSKYEIPSGKIDVNGVRFQGGGKGLTDLFLSTEKRYDRLGLEGSFGWTIPFDTVRQSGFVHYHAHINYELLKNFSQF